jgi:hypothetical protein
MISIFVKFYLQGHDSFIIVCVPLFNVTILSASKEVVSFGDKFKAFHRVVMGENGLVAVSKVQTPDLDISVCAASANNSRVVRDVHAQNGQLVPIQGNKELENKNLSKIICDYSIISYLEGV